MSNLSSANIGTSISSQVADAVGPDPSGSAFPMVGDFNNPLIIGGFTMPGKWTLHKCERMFGWQVKLFYGLSGAIIVPKGDPLAVVEFRAEFWRQSDYALYRSLRPILLMQAVNNLPGSANGSFLAANQIQTLTALQNIAQQTTTTGQATVASTAAATTVVLGTNHPELNALGVKAVVNLKVGATIDRGGGLWEARIDFMEWRAPVPAKPQPTQVVSGIKQPPIANSPASAQIASLTAQVAAARAALRP